MSLLICTHRYRLSLTTALLSLVFLLSACGDTSSVPQLPEGEQTVQGVLKPAALSLLRRGTHILQQSGEDMYFVESAQVNLRAYEQKLVTLRGVFEQNVEPDMLPVLVAGSVVDVEATTKDWSIPTLHLSVTAPVQWDRQTQGGQTFFVTEAATQPVVVLYRSPTDAEDSELALPEDGVSIVVDGKPAVRLVDEQTGGQEIVVYHNQSLIHILFSPHDHPDPERLREDWLAFLSSLQFDDTPTPPPSPTTGTGSVGGTPCGGPAGILCPAGQYCEVTDTTDDIGVCRPL